MSDLEELQAQKDGAYRERDALVCLVSKLYPAHLARHEGADWEDDWRWIVCVHLPTGQATWHIHDSERWMFGHLSVMPGHWDGTPCWPKIEPRFTIDPPVPSEQSGLTMAHVTDGIVCEAMRRGWRVDPKPSLILEDIRDGRQDFSR